LPVTAPRLVDTVVDKEVDSVVTKEVTVVDKDLVVDVQVDRLATHVVAMDTCQETVPKVKSATTVERLDI